MATPPELLTRWSDPILGELGWGEADRAWRGTTTLAGRVVRLSLGPLRDAPSRDGQIALIEPSRALLDRLRGAEPDLRRRAAERLAEQVYEPKAQGEWLPEDIAASLELEEVCLQGKDGLLHYSWPEHPPRSTVLVFFDEHLEFEYVD